MLAYFETHNVQYMTDYVIFQNLASGEVYQGKAEVGGMLH